MHWCFLLAFLFRVKNLSYSHWHRNTADSIRRNTAVSMWATCPQPYDAHSDLTDFSQSPHFSPAPCHGFHSSQWRPLFHHALSADFYLAHNNVMVLFDNEFKSVWSVYCPILHSADKTLHCVQQKHHGSVCLSLYTATPSSCSPFIQHNNDVVQFVIQVVFLHRGAGVLFYCLHLNRSNLVDRKWRKGI